jgi:hypothetical protein
MDQTADARTMFDLQIPGVEPGYLNLSFEIQPWLTTVEHRRRGRGRIPVQQYHLRTTPSV